MRLSLTYTRDYILIANFVGMALIPFVILTILNLKLFRAIKVDTIWILSCPVTQGRRAAPFSFYKAIGSS